MTDIARAVSIASGVQKPKDTDEFLWAYQTVVDQAIAWTLPHWVGKTAWEMIEAGYIYLPSHEKGKHDA